MSETTLAIMLIVAILVLGVVMETISLPQQGVAYRGCTPGSIADEASNGLCLQRGNRGCAPGSIADEASNGLCLRDTPTGFNIRGTGTGSSETFVCNTEVPPGEISIDFQAIGSEIVGGGEIVNGSYLLFTSNFLIPGVLTDGTADGNTYTLSGTNQPVCPDDQGNRLPAPMTLNGDCGDGVRITYRDPNTEGTLTGNVECTLLS
jgi:hypothetical protein